MIVVTGTRRCGSSLWMQILHRAGIPVIGEAFPGDWEQSLREANPHGFYESLLRLGVYYRTNPHPETGEFLRANEATRHAVKIFMPGLIKTDLSYLDRVIASVRPWREYEASLARMTAMEDHTFLDAAGIDYRDLHMPAALEWWDENYAFVRDLSIRKFACHVQSFDGLLANPREVITKVLDWIGPHLCPNPDLEGAVTCVKIRTRTQHLSRTICSDDSQPPAIAEVFDAYYEAVHRGEGLSGLLVERMNEVNHQLAPEIAQAREAVEAARLRASELLSPARGGPFWRFDGW